MVKYILLLLMLVMLSATHVHSKDVPFTQEDRDRLIRVEEGLKATNQRIDGFDKSVNQRIDGFDKSVNQRIDGFERSVNQRIDELKISNQQQFDKLYTLILWGFGILFGGMGMLISFVMWDRRTALAPAIDKIKAVEEREELLERVLKEMARKDANTAEALRHAGLIS
ncbi:MAG: hypothetical protein Q7T53_06080 [Deltaproteobacteria bacterium]|nr:hypothetical protein [Deltaproteobacteria bacterium]